MRVSRPEDVPDNLLAKIKTKATYRKIAEGRARKLGLRLEELPDSEWRRIWWERSERRHKYYVSCKKKEAMAAVEEMVPPPGSVADYLRYYTDPTPNDLLTIQQLVSMQQQLEAVDTKIRKLLAEPRLDTGQYAALSKIQKELSAETRLLQETLGISRRQREARRQEQNLADYLQANIRQARQLLDERGLKLICPFCDEAGQRILQGFVIHHFPEMGLKVITRCPACQREYEVLSPAHDWQRNTPERQSVP